MIVWLEGLHVHSDTLVVTSLYELTTQMFSMSLTTSIDDVCQNFHLC